MEGSSLSTSTVASSFSEEQLEWLKTAMGQPLVIPPAGEDTAHLAGTSSTPASASTLPAADGSGEQLNLTYSSLIPIKAIVIRITASLGKRSYTVGDNGHDIISKKKKVILKKKKKDMNKRKSQTLSGTVRTIPNVTYLLLYG